MKLLQVAHTFLPKYVAGTEIYTYEISQALRKKKNEVRIAYTDPLSHAYALNKIKYKEITCYEMQKDISNIFSFEDSFRDKTIEDFFIDILNDYKPDLIHYQHVMFLSTNIIELAKKRKIRQVLSLHDFWFQCLTHKRITTENMLCVNPTIDTCIKCHKDLLNRNIVVPPFRLHNIDPFISFLRKRGSLDALTDKVQSRIAHTVNYHFNKNKLREQLADRLNAHRNVLKSVDLVIYPTKFLQTELYKWDLKGKSNIISSDGIQDAYFRKFKRIRSKKIRFAFIGSIVAAKGLLVLVKAWEKANTAKAILKVYGNISDDPDYAKKVMEIVSRQKNIEIKGGFKPDQIGKVFEEIDMLIVPSTWFENAPLVLRDALLSHTPAIATNLGGLTELINEKKSGLLFENGNSDDLADKIAKVIKNPELLRSFAFPRQKNIKQNADELISLYRKIYEN
jgi:glycosyltransferase involved in cell wall biosynthesis